MRRRSRPLRGRLLFWKERLSLTHLPAGDIEPGEGVEALRGDRSWRAELRPQLLRFFRHERRDEHGLPRELTDERREGDLELAALGGILGLLPRRAPVDVLVAARHALPDDLERFMQEKAAGPVHHGVIVGDVRRILL